MTTASNFSDVQEPISTAAPEVRQIIERVCQLEKNRLDRKSQGHINDDVVKIIKEEVQ